MLEVVRVLGCGAYIPAPAGGLLMCCSIIATAFITHVLADSAVLDAQNLGGRLPAQSVDNVQQKAQAQAQTLGFCEWYAYPGCSRAAK